MNSVSRNVYVDRLYDVVNEYNNSYHRTIKMKPVDVKDNTHIDFKKEANDKDPKYKNIFAKGYSPNWSEKVSMIKKDSQTYVINDVIGEKIIGAFYEKELKKTNQQEFRIEKVIKRKGDKLYVKWKGYDSSFNSWID